MQRITTGRLLIFRFYAPPPGAENVSGRMRLKRTGISNRRRHFGIPHRPQDAELDERHPHILPYFTRYRFRAAS